MQNGPSRRNGRNIVHPVQQFRRRITGADAHIGHARHTLAFNRCFTVGAHRRFAVDLKADNDGAVTIRRQFHTDNLPHRQTSKTHVRGIRQAGHRREFHVIIGIALVKVHTREPHQKAQNPHHTGKGKGPDQNVISFGFHALPYSFSAVSSAARARGP